MRLRREKNYNKEMNNFQSTKNTFKTELEKNKKVQFKGKLTL
jgi:hypothetical protein